MHGANGMAKARVKNVDTLGAVKHSGVTSAVMHASKPAKVHAGQRAQTLETTGWHGIVKRGLLIWEKRPISK